MHVHDLSFLCIHVLHHAFLCVWVIKTMHDCLPNFSWFSAVGEVGQCCALGDGCMTSEMKVGVYMIPMLALSPGARLCDPQC